MKRTFALVSVLTALILLLTTPLFAQFDSFGGGNSGFNFNLGDDSNAGLGQAKREAVEVTGKIVFAGGENLGQLILEAVVPDGFHMYSITQKAGGPTAAKLTVDSSNLFTIAGPIRVQTPPEIKKVDYYDVPIEEHRGTVTWTVPVKLADGVKASDVEIKGSLFYQICDDVNGTCLEPTTATFTAKFDQNASVAVDANPTSIPTPDVSDPKGQKPVTVQPVADNSTENTENPPVEEAKSGLSAYTTQQLIVLAFSAFLGGLILNVMPCVLPVISLKLMAFIDQAGESRFRVFILNVWYVAGLLTVFIFLAFLSTYGLSIFTGKFSSDSGLGWGEMYSYTGVQITMCVFIFVMALSMLGVWEIPIPGFLGTGAVNDVQQKEGFVGAFTKGIFTTLLAVPCTGPFLGPILGLIMGAPLSFTLLIFTMIGLGMGFPYLLVGLFPEMLSFLPKPGAWMVTVREVMGFLLLGTTVYFFRMVPSELMVPVLTLLFSLWFLCWIVNKIPYGATFGQRMFNWSIGILVVVFFTGWMYRAYTVNNEFPWSDQFGTESQTINGVNPILAYAEKEHKAGRVVMLEFTADWCPNCKANMFTAIETKAVEDLIRKNKIYAAVCDWSRKPQDPNVPDAIKDALKHFGRQSIPMLAILPPGDAQPIILDGVITKGQLVNALEKALGSESQSASESEPQPVTNPAQPSPPVQPNPINEDVKAAYGEIGN